jgi:hypothetical protein
VIVEGTQPVPVAVEVFLDKVGDPVTIVTGPWELPVPVMVVRVKLVDKVSTLLTGSDVVALWMGNAAPLAEGSEDCDVWLEDATQLVSVVAHVEVDAVCPEVNVKGPIGTM